MRVEHIGDATLYLGDCLEILPTLEANSIDAVVTDPPYGLSFMGKAWDKGVPSVDVWREVFRVLKPGGHLLCFAGTRTQHRMASAIEDAGFEVRDMIAWVYGSGFPKSHNLKGEWDGWGTALKPALEPITVARKPLTGTVAANVLEWGTGAINADGCRVGTGDDKGVWPITNRRHNDVAYTVDPIETDTTKGRWPANLIHDGSDEVVRLFPETKSTPRTPTKGGAGGVGRNTNFQRGSETSPYSDSGSAARFFYCAKASKRDRDEGCEGMEAQPTASAVGMGRVTAANWGDENQKVYERKTKARNNHPTVKPTDLMRYLVRLVTPPGGVVLDPYMGSGSTGKAAVLESFQFIGIEISDEYMDIAKARTEAAKPEPVQQELV